MSGHTCMLYSADVVWPKLAIHIHCCNALIMPRSAWAVRCGQCWGAFFQIPGFVSATTETSKLSYDQSSVWQTVLVLGHHQGPWLIFPSYWLLFSLGYKQKGRAFETGWGEILNLRNPSGRTRPWGSLSLWQKWVPETLVVKELDYKPEGSGFETGWGEILNLANPPSRTRPWGSLSLWQKWVPETLVVKALGYKLEGRGFETGWGEILNLANPSGRTRPWGLLSL
jgi:hypothetical protein